MPHVCSLKILKLIICHLKSLLGSFVVSYLLQRRLASVLKMPQ